MNESTNIKRSANRTAASDASARVAVNRMCGSLLHLPLHWLATLEGIKPNAYLAKVTGISKSRIAEGSPDRLRPSTLKKAQCHSLQLARESAGGIGWTEKELDEMVASMPRRSDGLPSQLGGLFHIWSTADGISLEHTIREAIAVEEFVSQLSVATSKDSVPLAQRAALRYLRTDIEPDPTYARGRADWEKAETWQSVEPLADRLAMSGFEGLFVTLDAEWGAQYLGGLRPEPVLLALSPDVALDAETKRPSRNRLRRPVRKLFELTYAIARRMASGRWPDKPPGRSVVAAILGQSDAHVGNYFDGTRNLTLNAFGAWWLRLVADASRTPCQTEQMPAPVMLARVALLWQAIWIETKSGKPRSVLVLDRDEYRRRWQRVRRRLSAAFPEGQGNWPAWVSTQLSLSDSSSSTAMSGRSSEPRESQ